MAHPQMKAWLVATLALVAACSSPNENPVGAGGASGTGGFPSSSAGGGVGGTPGTAGAPQAGTSSGAGTGGGPSGGANTAGSAGAAGNNNGGGAGAGGASGGGGGGSGGQAAGGTSGAAGAAGQAGGGAGGAGGYNPCPTGAGMPCIVLPLGDSITEGYMASGANGGYRVEIFRRAVQDAKGVTFVGSLKNGPAMVSNKNFPQQHEGHGGYTIDSGTGHSGISGQITDSAISGNKPHIVLLMIGTNDINGNIDVGNAPTRLGTIIDEIITDAPKALVVVSTIIPMNNGNNSKGVTYNGAIGNLISTRAQAGKHVVMIDSYAAFAKDANYKTSLMSDTLHPNETGYALIGTTFYAAIGAFLPPG